MFKRSRPVLMTLASVTALSAAMLSASMNAAGAADATLTPTTGPTLTPAPTSTPAVFGTGGTQIAFWNGLTGSDGTTMDSMVANFVKENPDYSITNEEIAWGTLYPKLQAAFVAGQPPDVFILHVSEIPQYAKLGVLQNVDDLFDTNGGPLPSKDFAQPSYDQTIVDGHNMGVLLDNHGFGTWVNQDLLTKAGLDPTTPPKDGVALLKELQTLTLDKNGKNAADPAFDANNIVQYGTALDWQHFTFQSLLFQFGGTVISKDGKTATLNSKAGVAALQTLVDWIYKYHVMPPPAGFDSWGSFAGGKVAILATGSWFRNFIAATKINWTTWPMYQAGPNPGVMFGAHVFLVPAGLSGDKLTAVKKMIVWMSNHDDQWAASGQIPARVSIREKLDPKLYPSNMTIGASFPLYGQMEVPSPVNLDIGTAEDPELDAALANQKTPQQALDDAAKRIQQVLDNQ